MNLIPNDADDARVGILLEDEPVRDDAAEIPHRADNLEECAEHTPLRPTAVSSHIGRRIGAYLLLHEIDEGGMGTVYLAARADGCFTKQVAVKLMKAGTGAADVVRRFLAEREVLARFDHPNIARLLDAGTSDDGVPYFVMDYVNGVRITSFVEERSLSVVERLQLFLKICSAVEAAHRNQIIHRDLKPSNILVNQDGEPKLLDFGIAKLLDDSDSCQQTALGKECLTPFFASPEQLEGKPVTIASDIYSLGVVLYQILTDALPFRRSPESTSRTNSTRPVQDQLPQRPSLAVNDRKRREQLSGDLDAIVLKTLQKNPAERYSSVTDFASDLRNHLARRVVSARATEKLYRFWRTFLPERRLQLVLVTLAIVTICISLLIVRYGQAPKVDVMTVAPGSTTTDVVAERLIFKARQLAMKSSQPDAKESLLQIVSLLDEAVLRDPHYLAAYSLLALTHLDLYWQGFDHTPARRELARSVIEKAERLYPNAGIVHLAKGYYAYEAFRDYDRARAELRIAEKLKVNPVEFYVVNASIDRRQGRWETALQKFERCTDVAPQNARFRLETAFTLEALRRYSEASRTYQRTLTVVPRDNFVRGQLAQLPFLERADIQSFRSEVESILDDDPKAATEIANALLNLGLAARDRSIVSRALAAISPEGLRDTCNNSLWTREWFVGLSARSFGDIDGAERAFAAARKVEEKNVLEQPDYAPAWSRLGLIDAGLGRKKDAIREGRHACELLPVSHDAWDGAQLIVSLATIYAWTGEKDLAFEQLDTAARVPAGVSYGGLALLPHWDSLRADPRFNKILKLLAPQ